MEFAAVLDFENESRKLIKSPRKIKFNAPSSLSGLECIVCIGLFRCYFGNPPTQCGKAGGRSCSSTVWLALQGGGFGWCSAHHHNIKLWSRNICVSKAALRALVGSRTSEGLQRAQASEESSEMRYDLQSIQSAN